MADPETSMEQIQAIQAAFSPEELLAMQVACERTPPGEEMVVSPYDRAKARRLIAQLETAGWRITR